MARLMFPAPSCIALRQARTRGSSIQLMREPDCYGFSNPRVGSEGTTTPPRVKQSQAASTPTWLSWDSSTRTLFRCRTALSQPCIFSLRSEEHTSELQSRFDLVCRLLLEKKKLYRTLTTIIATNETLSRISYRS